MSGVSSDATVAPWLAPQLQRLLAQRGHAWLLQGPSGLGQYELAMALVSAWLCDQPSAQGACGTCASCHAIAVRSHTDLCVLMPETDMIERNWPLSEKAQAEIDDKKRKPSKEIRVEAMRDAVEFAQRTSGRGRGKAILVYPAERMNMITANALLKTLEEPSGQTQFVLATEAAHQLLPTIRSRCLAHTMDWPTEADSVAWLQTQSVTPADARLWLRAAGGRPDVALQLAASGMAPTAWAALPKAIARGDVSPLAQWGPAQVLDVLQKLCHDQLALVHGAAPRFFQTVDLPANANAKALSAWSRELMQASRTVEHPFNAGLMLEALVNQARQALSAR